MKLTLLKALALVLVTAVTSVVLTRKTLKPKLEPLSLEFLREVSYGRELISHTARYLGPKGSVTPYISSRMNCQNCHLDAGTKPFGINLQSIHVRYPEYRAREGKVVTLIDRINHCVERPMNGRPLPATGKEMRALLSYFQYLARGIPTGSRIQGDRLNEIIRFPMRAADPQKGKLVFESQCVRCHGDNGQGKLFADGVEYEYPPLWGMESFNEASSMHRNIKLAAFIKANMPLGATWDKPMLSDEEAFDVAAFINDFEKHPRPKSKWVDYANLLEKPIDSPKGPYADAWDEMAHRLGPYPPIIESIRKENRVAYY